MLTAKVPPGRRTRAFDGVHYPYAIDLHTRSYGNMRVGLRDASSVSMACIEAERMMLARPETISSAYVRDEHEKLVRIIEWDGDKVRRRKPRKDET